MEKAARDLDFMEAARLRDEMFALQKRLEEMKVTIRKNTFPASVLVRKINNKLLKDLQLRQPLFILVV